MTANWSPPKRAHEIDVPDQGTQALGQLVEYAVAAGVPVPVVQQLELVQVQQQQGERVAEAVGALAFVKEPVLEGAVAGDVGQGVHGAFIVRRTLVSLEREQRPQQHQAAHHEQEGLERIPPPGEHSGPATAERRPR